MRSLTCIVCPIGCALSVEEGPEAALSIIGNRCPRGAVYAQEEIRAPRRVVTATCGIADAVSRIAGATINGPRRVPVKTQQTCPRERINDLLADIYKTRVRLPVKAGDAVITDWQGSGINVVAVRDLG
jgi:CxxC motif-containing protein